MDERLTQLAAIAADNDYEGLGVTEDGQAYVDRRLTIEAVERLGLEPRSADLGIPGAAIVYLSSQEEQQIRAALEVQREEK